MNRFVDQVKIKVRSGDGGNGLVAWRREKYEPLGGPAGGTGGTGGHTILKATEDLSTLYDFYYKTEFCSENGQRGGPKNKHGKNGEDLVIYVPIGTIVKDLSTNKIIADLSCTGETVLVAQGGRGGRGNAALSTQANRAPYFCEPGEQGIERHLELTLKLLADVGLIGLPNAGKSTLLSILTAARPKIANYPFSTLSPNLGVIKGPGEIAYVLADIPGLISGASQGLGLGHTFLKHIERTRLLVHLADASSENLEEDLKTINTELELYDVGLTQMPQIVFLNKCDLLTLEQAQTLTEQITKNKNKIFSNANSIIIILSGSCSTLAGIENLKNQIFEQLAKIPKNQPSSPVEEDIAASTRPDNGFSLSCQKNTFYISGDRIERLLSVTNSRNPESLQHFFHILRSMGVIEALTNAGVERGSEVVIGKTSFIWEDEFF